MDNGVYNKNEKKEFINHNYFKPIVFSPVKEDFKSSSCLKFMDQNKKVIVNGVLFLLLVLLLILLFFSNHTKCLKKMKLK
jgi:hypothetical protein